MSLFNGCLLNSCHLSSYTREGSGPIRSEAGLEAKGPGREGGGGGEGLERCKPPWGGGSRRDDGGVEGDGGGHGRRYGEMKDGGGAWSSRVGKSAEKKREERRVYKGRSLWKLRRGREVSV